MTGAGSLLDANGDRITVGTTPSSGVNTTGTGSGSLTIAAGATAKSGANYGDTEAALAIGGAAQESGTLVITGAGSRLDAAGSAVIGGNNSGSGAAAGGTGTVSLTSGGVLTATSLVSFAGSSLSVDAGSTAVIGTSAGTVGALTVDAGATLSGAGAIHASVIDNGAITASGGTLTIDSVRPGGAGTLGATGGTLDLLASSNETLSFGAAGTIRIHAPSAGNTVVQGFATGDVLDFASDRTRTAVVAADDGQPDLLIQNTNGTLVDFLMNGATPVIGYQLLGPNTGYSVAGTGNYNGDNRADIVLHDDDGSNLVLYGNGQSIVGSGVPTGNPGPTWNTVVAGVDYNGDGASDLLYENSGGSIVGFDLNSSNAITSSGLITNPGPGWHAFGGPPIQFIDGTTAAATVAGTPGADEFNFTSFTAGIHTITNFDAATDLIALSAAGFSSYAAVQAHQSAYNGGTAIGLSASTALVIQGITPSQLSSANFVLR